MDANAIFVESELYFDTCYFPLENCNNIVGDGFDSFDIDGESEGICDTCVEGCNNSFEGFCAFGCLCYEFNNDPDFVDLGDQLLGCNVTQVECSQDFAERFAGFADDYDYPLEPVPEALCDFETFFRRGQCFELDYEEELGEELFSFLVGLGFGDISFFQICLRDIYCEILSEEEQPFTKVLECDTCISLDFAIALCLDAGVGFGPECDQLCDCDFDCKLSELQAEEGDMFDYDECLETCLAE